MVITATLKKKIGVGEKNSRSLVVAVSLKKTQKRALMTTIIDMIKMKIIMIKVMIGFLGTAQG